MKVARYRQVLLLLVTQLLVAVTLIGYISNEVAAESHNSFISVGTYLTRTPISLKTTMHFPDYWGDQPGTIWLAGLGTEQNAVPDTLALQWSQGVWSWFPSWRLQLTGTAGLSLKSVDTKKLPVDNDGNLILSTAQPTPGHDYTSVVSYDAGTGLVSVAVTDMTDGKAKYTGMFNLHKPSDSPSSNRISGTGKPNYLFASVGVTGEVGTALPSFGVVNTTNTFIPVWQQWEIGALRDQPGMYEPVYFVERNSLLAIRLASQARLKESTGQYRVLLDNGTSRPDTILPDSINDGNWTPLNVGALPLGNVDITLQYLADGKVWLSQTRKLSVGSLALRINDIQVQPKAKTLRGSVSISSNSDLSGLEMELQVKISRIIWDNDRRAFEEADSVQIPLFSRRFTSSDTESIVPFVIPLPPEPGFWKLSAVTTNNIPVRTELTGSDQLFTTNTPAQPESDQDYAIAVFPDTQNYTVNNQDILTRQAQWVAENAVKRNIALVLHMGDVTQDNTRQQWQKAQVSLGLLDPVVPYVLTVGNHDMAPGGGVRARGDTLINEYFSTSRFAALNGTFAPNRVENSYHTLNIGGVDYMVISLEFGPPNEVLAWANDVVANHPKHRVIVITHTFVNRDGSKGGDPKRYGLAHNPQTTVNDGNDMWSKFLSKHANIFMVMSGHIGGPTIPYNISIGQQGNWVYSFLMDYQSEPQGGNGWLVLFTFHSDKTVEVQAYSPYLGQFKPQVDSHGFNNHYMIDLEGGSIKRLDAPQSSL